MSKSKKNDYNDYLAFASLSARNGDVCSCNGEIEKAKYFYNRAAKFYKMSSQTDIHDLAYVFECLGDLNYQTSNFDEADNNYGESQKIYEDIKDNYHLAIVLRNRSLCYYFKDDLSKTIEFLKRSFSLFEIIEKSNDFTELNKDSFNREFFITCVFLYEFSKDSNTIPKKEIKKYSDLKDCLLIKLPPDIRFELAITTFPDYYGFNFYI